MIVGVGDPYRMAEMKIHRHKSQPETLRGSLVPLRFYSCYPKMNPY